MTEDAWRTEFDAYMRAITPDPHDPTYSVLKAHLKFEELLRAYLDRVLAHPKALKGSRLSFAQLLAIARACSATPDEWGWVAVGKLNKLRNMLAHEAESDDLGAKIDDYVKFIISSTGEPLPEANVRTENDKVTDYATGKPLFSALDMVTGGLYSYFGEMLASDKRSLAPYTQPTSDR